MLKCSSYALLYRDDFYKFLIASRLIQVELGIERNLKLYIYRNAKDSRASLSPMVLKAIANPKLIVRAPLREGTDENPIAKDDH